MEENHNTNNDINSKNSYNNIVIVILVILLIGSLSFICYDKFINRETNSTPVENPNGNNGNNEKGVVGFVEIEKGKSVVLPNGKTLKFNIEDVTLVDDLGKEFMGSDNVYYINNKKVDRKYITNYDGAHQVYITDKYVLAITSMQCGSKFSRAFDLDGNEIEIKENYNDSIDNGVEGGCKNAGLDTDNIKKEANKLLVKVLYYNDTLEILYDGKIITIQKTNN